MKLESLTCGEVVSVPCDQQASVTAHDGRARQGAPSRTACCGRFRPPGGRAYGGSAVRGCHCWRCSPALRYALPGKHPLRDLCCIALEQRRRLCCMRGALEAMHISSGWTYCGLSNALAFIFVRYYELSCNSQWCPLFGCSKMFF